MSPLVLIVDSHANFAAKLAKIAESIGWNTAIRSTFEEARRDIAAWAPRMLVTNVKLGGFNGIHLVYLAKASNPGVVGVTFTTGDVGLGHEAQRAGAFYERCDDLPISLPRYLTAELPQSDRRDVRIRDRRTTFRGGRRSTDLEHMYHPPTGSDFVL